MRTIRIWFKDGSTLVISGPWEILKYPNSTILRNAQDHSRGYLEFSNRHVERLEVGRT